ncbi:glycosyltransferase family 4 protein [Methylococcus sp. ANG]|uniref:glycosyltransferase family 4 protein n=1 Tax=Methylococcus sp. ANG TaxID=3231903 RepID=UPI00345A15DC
MIRNSDALVINFTAPEINHLAAALAQSGRLYRYVRPYANLGRFWERGVQQIPALNGLYQRSFGRRVMPTGLNSGLIVESAVVHDFLNALAKRIGNKRIADWSHWNIQKCVATVGADFAGHANIVVGSYCVALPAFQKTSGIKILNYPIAHHKYIQEFVAEEAEREPELASTLPDWSVVPAWVESQMDAECALADRILVGSNFVRDSFISAGVAAEKLCVIPYGANCRRFTPAVEKPSSRDTFNMLFVGQIGQRKGISYLLRAYRTFRRTGTSLTLVGNYVGDKGALARFSGSFEHIPHVSHAELAEIYRRADVFVFPTLIEGMPLVVLEAMASGLPIITTPNGPGDIVRDGIDGFVVPIRDVDAIVEKLEYLRANPQERLRMGYNARERALTFTWQNYQQRIIDLLSYYDELL